VFGLFGATFVVARRLNLDIRWLIILIAANLVITFTVPGVSWQGHLGGLVTGALIAAAYVYPAKERRTAVQIGVSVAALVVFAALIAWRTVGLIDYYGVLITG
jgi:membrane associated rhomboid family serine protease